MKRNYAEQFNKLLEDYVFKTESNPDSKELYYGILACGVQHLYALAFCSDDNETLDDLHPLIESIMRDIIPEPVNIDMEMAAWACF